MTSVTRQDLPMIETRGIRVQVPLSDQRSRISCLLKQFRKCHLGSIEASTAGVCVEPIIMAMFAG